MSAEPIVHRQSHGSEPVFCDAIPALNTNMRRFTVFATVEKSPIPIDAENRRHLVFIDSVVKPNLYTDLSPAWRNVS